MTSMLIESEGDLELAIGITVNLAKRRDSNIELRFWRKAMADLFMEGLFDEFDKNGIKEDCNLVLDVYILSSEGFEDDEDDEDKEMSP